MNFRSSVLGTRAETNPYIFYDLTALEEGSEQSL